MIRQIQQHKTILISLVLLNLVGIATLFIYLLSKEKTTRTEGAYSLHQQLLSYNFDTYQQNLNSNPVTRANSIEPQDVAIGIVSSKSTFKDRFPLIMKHYAKYLPKSIPNQNFFVSVEDCSSLVSGDLATAVQCVAASEGQDGHAALMLYWHQHDYASKKKWFVIIEDNTELFFANLVTALSNYDYTKFYWLVQAGKNLGEVGMRGMVWSKAAISEFTEKCLSLQNVVEQSSSLYEEYATCIKNNFDTTPTHLDVMHGHSLQYYCSPMGYEDAIQYGYQGKSIGSILAGAVTFHYFATEQQYKTIESVMPHVAFDVEEQAKERRMIDKPKFISEIVVSSLFMTQVAQRISEEKKREFEHSIGFVLVPLNTLYHEEKARDKEQMETASKFIEKQFTRTSSEHNVLTIEPGSAFTRELGNKSLKQVVLSVLLYARKQFADKKWIFVGTDTTYVAVSNLEVALEHFDPETNIYIGGINAFREYVEFAQGNEETTGLIPYGSGFVVSKAFIDRLQRIYDDAVKLVSSQDNAKASTDSSDTVRYDILKSLPLDDKMFYLYEGFKIEKYVFDPKKLYLLAVPGFFSHPPEYYCQSSEGLFNLDLFVPLSTLPATGSSLNTFIAYNRVQSKARFESMHNLFSECYHDTVQQCVEAYYGKEDATTGWIYTHSASQQPPKDKSEEKEKEHEKKDDEQKHEVDHEEATKHEVHEDHTESHEEVQEDHSDNHEVEDQHNENHETHDTHEAHEAEETHEEPEDQQHNSEPHHDEDAHTAKTNHKEEEATAVEANSNHDDNDTVEPEPKVKKQKKQEPATAVEFDDPDAEIVVSTE